MVYLVFAILGLWILRETKTVLFWIYLWQLKEYHWGRFKAHFSTHKGKKLLFDPLRILKFCLLILLIFWWQKGSRLLAFSFVSWSAVLGGGMIYLAEGAKFVKDVLVRKIRKPVFTLKIYSILGVTLFLLIGLFWEIETFWLSFEFGDGSLIWGLTIFLGTLLLLDILTPLITSAGVMAGEPIAILWRKKIIQKATQKRKKFKDLLVIGITGSYGKTSTKEFLAHILSEKFKVLKTKQHQNSEVGISQCILDNLSSEHEIFVCEMGAYNRGGIKLLADIAQPQIGILSGISSQHLATFGSLENIVKTKYELIESLPSEGLAVFNGNNSYVRDLYDKTDISKKICGWKKNIPFDLRAQNIGEYKSGLSFEVVTSGGQKEKFGTDLLGTYNIENILLACCVARYIGLDLKQISKRVRELQPLSGALSIKKNSRGVNILDATYSANLNGVLSHLDYLENWSGKKIIVMPCLIELGSDSFSVHQKIGSEIGKRCNLAIITSKECFKIIKKAAMESGLEKENILYIEKPKLILDKIKEFSDSGDVILLESRVPQKVISDLTR